MSVEHQPQPAPERKPTKPESTAESIQPDPASPSLEVDAGRLASPEALAHPTANRLRQADILRSQGTLGNRQVARMLAQRQDGAAPAATETPAAAPQAGLIVDDGTADLGPGQLTKSAFLSQLRTAVAAAAGDALSGTPWGETAGPEIERRLATYRGLDAAALERTLRREVPAATRATSAAGYVPIVADHVRTTVQQQVPSGGVLGAVAGAASAAASAVAGAVGGALSAIGGLFFKRRPDGGTPAGDPSVLRSQLGPGQGLDGGVRSGMESAFGRDFSGVRVHTDGRAAGQAANLDARAFTIGEDVAFGAGEYQPGTPIGDALIAHELAHVAQQDGATAGPLTKGGEETTAFEEEADRSAISAVASIWGGAKTGMANVAEQAVPRLKTGLRLQRCSKQTPVPPVQSYMVPSTQTPLSAPGEQLIFRGEFTHATPSDFQLDYTAVGGHFDTAAGSATKTIPGLKSGNVYFFIDAAWNGTDPLTVKLEVKKASDSSVIHTTNWTFGKKPYFATTITQQEPETERDLGSTYVYKLGPDRGGDAIDDYLNHTVLETFGQRTCNITLAELKPEFKAAHPEITTQDAITAHFFGTSSNNSSFSVKPGDVIRDRHRGSMPDKSDFEAALITMKEITCDLPQTYEVEPGVPLGRYTIRRILKTDGSKKLRKFRVP